MAGIPFKKLQGTGNDFMFLNGVANDIRPSADIIRSWGDRHIGVGFDQLVVVEQSSRKEADFRMRVFNRDGSETHQCGNGARCFPLYAQAEGLTRKNTLAIEIGDTIVTASIVRRLSSASVESEADIGVPDLSPSSLPFYCDGEGPPYTLRLGNECSDEWAMTPVSLGNPHMVTIVEDVDVAPVDRIGHALQHLSSLPNGANVGFLQIVNPAQACLRVFERGVGETLSCGSGACAAMVTGRIQGLIKERCTILQSGGALKVNWSGVASRARIAGISCISFEGVVRT